MRTPPRNTGFQHPIPSEITPKAIYEDRRQMLKLMAGGAAGAAMAAWASREALAQQVVRPGKLAPLPGAKSAVAAICIAAVGFNLPSSYAALALFVCTMLGLGAGNGAVFQLVPQRFRREIGVMTGLIGMAGGIGGFALAAGMGAIKQSTGSYQMALWLFASLGVLAWFGLHGVKRRWRTTWGSAAVTAARV